MPRRHDSFKSVTSVSHPEILLFSIIKSPYLVRLVSHRLHKMSIQEALLSAQDPLTPLVTFHLRFLRLSSLDFRSSGTTESQTPVLEFPSTSCSRSSATDEGSYASVNGRGACIHELRSMITSVVRILLSSGCQGRVISRTGYLQNNCSSCHYASIPLPYCKV